MSQTDIRLFGASHDVTPASLFQGVRGVRDEDPAGYVVGKDLADAINAAILLGQPLLLTGDPGVGKTSVGRAVADGLNLPLLEFTVKSTSRAVDLFYEYDAVGRFHAAEAERANTARLSLIASSGLASLSEELSRQLHRQAAADPRREMLRYIKVRALGRAILNAILKEESRLLVAGDDNHAALGQRYMRSAPGMPGAWHEVSWPPGPVQSLVIIDEIDKAPTDFCNDLLDELDLMRFQVPELATFSETGDAPRFGGALPLALRPIVIITSNQERPLPDAFLRRCCYHHIQMPEGEALNRIVLSRLADSARLSQTTLSASLKVFRQIAALPLVKKPGLAELLGWLRYIYFHHGAEPTYDIAADQAFLKQSLVVLIKDLGDLRKAEGAMKASARE